MKLWHEAEFVAYLIFVLELLFNGILAAIDWLLKLFQLIWRSLTAYWQIFISTSSDSAAPIQLVVYILFI